MANQSIAKPKCQTCGHKIPTTRPGLSSIEFRRRINGIKTMEELTDSKKYIAQFVKSRFWLKEYVDEFLRRLDEITDQFAIDDIKTWILEYRDNSIPESKGLLLGKDPESPLYEFLCLNYPDLDDTFHEFYDNYSQSVSNPLHKNHVSRALNALGIKPVMKKIKLNDPDSNHVKVKCTIVLYATKEVLSEILKKNGF